jgi:hypothetical protein
MTTTFIGLIPTLIRTKTNLSGPNSIYDDKVFGAWPNKIWAEFT